MQQIPAAFDGRILNSPLTAIRYTADDTGRRHLPAPLMRSWNMADVAATRVGWAPASPTPTRPLTHWRLALRSLRRDKLALAAAVLLLIVVVLTLAAPLIAPYDPIAQRTELRNSRPGSGGYILGGDELGRD